MSGGTFLTEAQKDLVTKSFALFGDSESVKRHGVQLMLSLFQASPELQDKFIAFKGMTATELEECSTMRAHGTSVMLQIKMYVENLQDMDCVIALVQKNVRNHVDRNVGFEEFEKVRAMFGGFLTQQFGDKVNPETLAAWDTFFSILSDAFK